MNARAYYAGGGMVAGAPAGIATAARQVQAMGRAPDTMLAHITPDEAEVIDYLQGGRRVNPDTGLPEYGLFGNILKAIARVGASVGGFMVGGPLGAAAAAGAVTKLTGGSWKDALIGAALSGVGGAAGQAIQGGGLGAVSLTEATKGAGAAAASAGSSAASEGARGGIQGIATSALPSAGGTIPYSAGAGALSTPVAQAGSNLGSFINVAKSAPGIGAGLGALSAPMGAYDNGPAPTPIPSRDFSLANVQPQPRQYRPYQGDPLKFAEPGSGGAEHRFYDPMNPKPIFRGPEEPIVPELGIGMYAGGGAILGPQGPNDLTRGLRGGGIEVPGLEGPSEPRQLGMGGNTQMLQRAAVAGYMNARDGGAVYGPGTETSDEIPARLSVNEHIVDAGTVRAFGRGNVDRGHDVIEKLKQDARRGVGVPDPKRPPAFQKKVARAKKRAGVK